MESVYDYRTVLTLLVCVCVCACVCVCVCVCLCAVRVFALYTFWGHCVNFSSMLWRHFTFWGDLPNPQAVLATFYYLFLESCTLTFRTIIKTGKNHPNQSFSNMVFFLSPQNFVHIARFWYTRKMSPKHVRKFYALALALALALAHVRAEKVLITLES